MRRKGEIITEQIKLTLHTRYDADVIKLLQAMPYGRKSKLIAEAIRRVFMVGSTGDVEFLSLEKGEEEVPSLPEVKPAERIKVQVEAF